MTTLHQGGPMKLVIMLIALIALMSCTQTKQPAYDPTAGMVVHQVCIEKHIYYVQFGFHEQSAFPKLTDDGKPCPCSTSTVTVRPLK